MSTEKVGTEAVSPAIASDPRIASALELWVVLARCCAAVACRAGADVARHGLTPGEFGVLEALYHRGPLLLGELQRKVLVSSGGVTYLVDRLAERGLVERRDCPSDRRARYAALTVHGSELMERIFPEHADALATALSGIGQGEQRKLANLLRKVGRHAASLDPAPGSDV
jgi:MarR family 2-MHQ and catechol resistance regulon transcriptional repressor